MSPSKWNHHFKQQEPYNEKQGFFFSKVDIFLWLSEENLRFSSISATPVLVLFSKAPTNLGVCPEL